MAAAFERRSPVAWDYHIGLIQTNIAIAADLEIRMHYKVFVTSGNFEVAPHEQLYLDDMCMSNARALLVTSQMTLSSTTDSLDAETQRF